MSKSMVWVLLLFVVIISSGCSSAWKRVNDYDRSLPIDRADCTVMAKTLVAERGNYISSTRVYAYTDRYGGSVANAKTKTKVDKNASNLYFLECMNQRGWVSIAASEDFSNFPEIVPGTFVLMDMSFKQGADVLRETHNGLYSCDSKVLSEDVKVRLLGKKINETIQFEKEVPTAKTATQVSFEKITVNIKINGIYKTINQPSVSGPQMVKPD